MAAEESALHEALLVPQPAVSTAIPAEASDSELEPMPLTTAHVERNICTCLCHALQSSHSPRCVDAAAEDTYGIEWHWDREHKSDYANVSESGNEVHFHTYFSSGTSAIRGTKAFTKGQHYWEIKMTSPVYGTDMMVGFGTDAVELGAYSDLFVSFLGLSSETWGVSYLGQAWHNGASRPFCRRFGQDSVVGVHLDMWLGRATFFIDGCLVGTAFSGGLRGKKLYPMVCSTAARTSMRVARACSTPDSLQFACCQTLRRLVPAELKLTDVLPLPPGLRHSLDNNLDWFVRPCKPPPLQPPSAPAAGAAAAGAAAPSAHSARQQPDRAAGLLQPSASAAAAARKRCMRSLGGSGAAVHWHHRPQSRAAAATRRCSSRGKRLKGESDDPTGSEDRDSADDDNDRDGDDADGDGEEDSEPEEVVRDDADTAS